MSVYPFVGAGSALAALFVPLAAARAQDTFVLPEIAVIGSAARPAGSLTVPTTEAARQQIEHTPGAVAVVPDAAYRNTQAATIKDVLDYVPGVFVQPKWGEDARLSIRGSGLSRNFHLRGMGAAGLFRRQRQFAEDGALCASRPARRL